MIHVIYFLLALAAIAILITELVMGIAIFNVWGPPERMLIDRDQRPGPYWLIMAIHGVFVLVFPLVSHLVDLRTLGLLP